MKRYFFVMAAIWLEGSYGMTRDEYLLTMASHYPLEMITNQAVSVLTRAEQDEILGLVATTNALESMGSAICNKIKDYQFEALTNIQQPALIRKYKIKPASPAHSFLISADNAYMFDPGVVYEGNTKAELRYPLFDINQNTNITLENHEGGEGYYHISPSYSLLAYQSANFQVMSVWSLLSGKRYYSRILPPQMAPMVMSNKDWFVIVQAEKNYEVLEANTGKVKFVLENASPCNNALNTLACFCPADRKVVTGIAPEENTPCLGIWDLSSGKLTFKIAGWNPAFNSDGTQIATCTGQGITIYETQQGHAIDKIAASNSASISKIVFSPSHSLLMLQENVIGHPPALQVWNLMTKEILVSNNGIKNFAIDNSQSLIVLDGNPQLHIPATLYDLLSNKKISLGIRQKSYYFFDPTSTYLACPFSPNELELRNTRTGAFIALLPHDIQAGIPHFNDQGNTLITLCNNERLVWNLKQIDWFKQSSLEKMAAWLVYSNYIKGETVSEKAWNSIGIVPRLAFENLLNSVIVEHENHEYTESDIVNEVYQKKILINNDIEHILAVHFTNLTSLVCRKMLCGAFKNYTVGWLFISTAQQPPMRKQLPFAKAFHAFHMLLKIFNKQQNH